MTSHLTVMGRIATSGVAIPGRTLMSSNALLVLFLGIIECHFLTIIRSPDIVCRRTCVFPGILSLSFFLSFFRRLISELAERNTTKIGHMVGSKCNLKKHVQYLGYPLPLQIGGPKTAFLGLLCNLTAILMAYIFGKKHDIDNRSSALTTTRGLVHRAKMS